MDISKYIGEATAYDKKLMLERKEPLEQSWDSLPSSHKPKVTNAELLDGTIETHTGGCPGCRKKDNSRHTGTYCKIMDWNSGEPVEFRMIANNGGVYGK